MNAITHEFATGPLYEAGATGAGKVASTDPLADWREAFTREGTSAAARAGGDFAVGVHNANGLGFMAVDHFGIRTLCYRVVDGQLRFAEHACDLADPGHPLDLQAIYDYLYFHAIPSPRTIYQGIFRLPPGHAARFEKGQLTVERYWTPRFRPEPGGGFDALKQEFHHLLRRAIERQLADGPAACFLSGGTDSSTVAGMLRQVTGQAPDTYSIGFEA
ncbi:MAG: asparagine synthase, partial [Rhodoferax sp.]|nr:asparagine synthase [Rhodoferax sp.]